VPELPEVETTRAGIAPWLEGSRIEDIAIRETRLRWPVVAADLTPLIGLTVRRVERRAKYLLLHVDRVVILLHLGMSGSLRVLEPDVALRKHDHLDLIVNHPQHGRKVIRFNDPRRFGCCLVLTKPVDEHPLLNSLGPEPLSDQFSARYLFSASRGRKLAVKNFIMDGKVVVGVGNIYASEALYLAGLRPGTAAGRVSLPRYQKLVAAIREVLSKAIAAGGTTLNDFTQSDGQPGYFRHELQVYGRAGEPCYRCGQIIRSRVIGQRSTFYCHDCQR
jgi:formamidopyrimidine-DNA glycosylase